MADVDAFTTRWPEFRSAGPLIPLALAEAEKRVNAAVFGDKRELAVQLLAAHTLAISPYGRSQRLVNDDGSTTYLEQFNAIKMEMRVGIITT